MLNIIAATVDQEGLPWLVWQAVLQTRSSDFKFFTRDLMARAAFEHQALWAQMSPYTFLQ